ncbi:copper chaperone PCu(A)C [Sphingomonas sp. PB2P12]|uniref:copper chaperone PCu(A)C n=1 Tax=Sphingomonas sandaracina TaxID=3096157 RepID=UPI002FCBDDB1
MRIVFVLGVAAMALASCSQPKELSVDGAWVRLGAVTGRPAAAYFTVHGGPTSATLISVTTDVAIKSEMHETMAKDGVTSMAPLSRVDIPANTDVAFAPGGRHVMLFNMNPGIKPADRVTLTFAFADGTRIINNATVVAAGTPVAK